LHFVHLLLHLLHLLLQSAHAVFSFSTCYHFQLEPLCSLYNHKQKILKRTGKEVASSLTNCCGGTVTSREKDCCTAATKSWVAGIKIPNNKQLYNIN
jgi:hypothetical protein